MKFIAKACGLTRKLSPCEHAARRVRTPTVGGMQTRLESARQCFSRYVLYNALYDMGGGNFCTVSATM